MNVRRRGPAGGGRGRDGRLDRVLGAGGRGGPERRRRRRGSDRHAARCLGRWPCPSHERTPDARHAQRAWRRRALRALGARGADALEALPAGMGHDAPPRDRGGLVRRRPEHVRAPVGGGARRGGHPPRGPRRRRGRAPLAADRNRGHRPGALGAAGGRAPRAPLGPADRRGVRARRRSLRDRGRPAGARRRRPAAVGRRGRRSRVVGRHVRLRVRPVAAAPLPRRARPRLSG